MTDTKLCECGCGQPTPNAKRTLAKHGYFKDKPLRFIPGHQCRGRKQSAEEILHRSASLKGHPVSSEARQKISEAHKRTGHHPSREAIERSNAKRGQREKHSSWRGGISYTNGRRCIYVPDHPRAHSNGYVYEHILISEQVLGRLLASEEVVHHIDNDPNNNDPANLMVLPSQSEHARLHHRLRSSEQD